MQSNITVIGRLNTAGCSIPKSALQFPLAIGPFDPQSLSLGLLLLSIECHPHFSRLPASLSLPLSSLPLAVHSIPTSDNTVTLSGKVGFYIPCSSWRGWLGLQLTCVRSFNPVVTEVFSDHVFCLGTWVPCSKLMRRKIFGFTLPCFSHPSSENEVDFSRNSPYFSFCWYQTHLFA